jgi:hypothetical protein
MLLVMLAAAASEPTSNISLACTTRIVGNASHVIFEINPNDKTYSAIANDSYTSKGNADLTDSAITLTEVSGKITMIYKISRTTGDVVQEGHLTGDPQPAVVYKGSCQKYSGKLF